MFKKFLAGACLLLSLGSINAQKTAHDSGAQFDRSIPNIYQKVSLNIDGVLAAPNVGRALLDHFAWMERGGFDLIPVYEKGSPYSTYYTFAQSHNGLPIYQHQIKANVTQDGRIISVMNGLQSYGDVRYAAASQGADEAIEHIKTEYSLRDDDPAATAEAMLFAKDGQLVSTYRVEFDYALSRWEAIVDANSLDILSRRDLGSFHHSYLMPPPDSDGVAMVFNPDPLTTSGNAYGATNDWLDNNDADNSALNGERQSVILQDLDYSNGIFRLQGPYVSIEQIEPPNIAPVTTTDGNFNFTRSQSGFEDVMCYYHIDTYQRYLRSIGFLNLYDSPLRVDPHALNGQDNSHFVPSGTLSRLGFGEGCVDDAEDADVIVHEYGHAVSFSANGGTNFGLERQGLDEGVGDYLAATYSKALSYTFWKNTFTWDGHNTCWDGRSASLPTLYPPGGNDIYVYGQIWASVLMEVHDQIGREASDKVFFQALYGYAGNMTMTDAARLILEADSIVYGGAHITEYQAAFCRRGILQNTECIVSRDEFSHLEPTWSLYPNPSEGSFAIYLDVPVSDPTYRFEVYDLTGRMHADGSIRSGNNIIDKTDWPTGVYIVCIRHEGVVIGRRRWVVER